MYDTFKTILGEKFFNRAFDRAYDFSPCPSSELILACAIAIEREDRIRKERELNERISKHQHADFMRFT